MLPPSLPYRPSPAEQGYEMRHRRAFRFHLFRDGTARESSFVEGDSACLDPDRIGRQLHLSDSEEREFLLDDVFDVSEDFRIQFVRGGVAVCLSLQEHDDRVLR